MGNDFFNKSVNDIIPQTKFGNLVVKVSLSANFISKATIKLSFHFKRLMNIIT